MLWVGYGFSRGMIVDGWPAPKVTKYVNYNSHLNN